MDTGRVGVRFQDRQAFARFCESLTHDKISYSLAGHRTVVLDESDFVALPDTGDKRAGIVSPITRGDRRGPLPTRAATEVKLWEYSKPR